jgi:hypothetical protein
MRHTLYSYLLGLIFLFFSYITHSQTITYDYRSDQNPYYWTKSKPYADYWQQDVHYRIKAKLNDSLNQIQVADYQLVYWNNSPDTLKELFFHLYSNAFQPNSYMHKLYLANDEKVKFGTYESAGLGTKFYDLTVNGETVEATLDNTILKIKLNKKLKPNDSLVVSMRFTTYFDKDGSMRRRMKYFEEMGSKHFDAVHWYPSICVYDKKFGWTTEQYLDKEFYADFGTFNIEISLPSHYIVEATGELTNEEEVLPDSLKKILEIDNYFTKKDTISTPILIDGSTKTWKYHAINVHNFAFTCDPKYRRKEVNWQGIRVIAQVMEHHCASWKGAVDFAALVTKIYSQDFGQYLYPKIVIADAKDGMEYPMLTLDNGTYPGNQGLLAHEMGHEWFYGMIGSNETYRALLDEGFTQFLTVWSLDKINGQQKDYKSYIKEDSKNKWQLNHLNPSENRYERLYYPYIKWVLEGYDHQLNTHSSDFNGAIRHGGGYGLVYYKTGVMLYNLRYVLGEELFLETMQNYFDTWKIKHPYPEDFRQSVISYTKIDLNWFFDQWLETTKYIDYSIERVRATDNKDEYEILFRRIGQMQMPIDFMVFCKDGKTAKFHIPNTWYEKKTDAQILPKWYGWDKIQENYTAIITFEGEIQNVVIDPQHYMADVNLANNQWAKRHQFQFDHRIKNYPNWYATENFWRPDLWYTAQDGIKIGLHLEGNYFKMCNRYSVKAGYNTGLFRYDFDKEKDKTQLFYFDGKFDQNLRKISRGLESHEELVADAGILKTNFSLSKRFKNRDLQATKYSVLSVNHQTLVQRGIAFKNYSLMENRWTTNRWNNQLNIHFDRFYDYTNGSGRTRISTRTPGFMSDRNYGFAQLESINRNYLGKIGLHTRFFGRFGYGNTPVESRVYLYGANPEELFLNRVARSQGLMPQALLSLQDNLVKAHFAGGMNLRGFSGLAIEKNNVFYRSGQHGLALNGEIEFSKLTKTKGKKAAYFGWLPYFFYDLGWISFNQKATNSSLLADAGMGIETQFKFHYLDIKPLIIRIEMPFAFANDKNTLKQHLVIGLGKGF